MQTKIMASAAVLLIFLVALFRLTPFAIKGIEVSSQVCDTSDDTETVTDTNWNDAILAVTIKEAENCAYALQAATVQRIGSHLFVRTSYASPSDMLTACHCRHSTTLRIPNLKQQEFQVHVYSWL